MLTDPVKHHTHDDVQRVRTHSIPNGDWIVSAVRYKLPDAFYKVKLSVFHPREDVCLSGDPCCLGAAAAGLRTGCTERCMKEPGASDGNT